MKTSFKVILVVIIVIVAGIISFKYFAQTSQPINLTRGPLPKIGITKIDNSNFPDIPFNFNAGKKFDTSKNQCNPSPCTSENIVVLDLLTKQGIDNVTLFTSGSNTYAYSSRYIPNNGPLWIGDAPGYTYFDVYSIDGSTINKVYKSGGMDTSSVRNLNYSTTSTNLNYVNIVPIYSDGKGNIYLPIADGYYSNYTNGTLFIINKDKIVGTVELPNDHDTGDILGYASMYTDQSGNTYIGWYHNTPGTTNSPLVATPDKINDWYKINL